MVMKCKVYREIHTTTDARIDDFERGLSTSKPELSSLAAMVAQLSVG